MKAEQASSTAKIIAASTLLLSSDSRTATLVAPGAAQLCHRFLSTSRADRWLAKSAVQPLTRKFWRWMERLTHPGIIAHYWYRKRWIESRCRSAIAEGFERVIVIGAGFDTLGCRLALEFDQLNVIEVDHPATQRTKRRVMYADGALRTGNLEFLALDLSTESLPATLTGDRRATVVIVEGVLMYLTLSEVDRLIHGVHQLSAERLRLIFSFMTRWSDGTSGFRPRSWLIERWLAWRNESFSWAIEPRAVGDFLAAHRFSIVELAETAQFTDTSGSDASVLEGENLVLCSRA